MSNIKDQFQVYQLGEEAISFIEDSLTKGGPLSRQVLESVNLRAGSVSTYLPAGLSTKELLEFNYGGKLPTNVVNPKFQVPGTNVIGRLQPIPVNDSDIIASIIRHLAGAPGHLILAENSLLRPGTPRIKSKSRVLEYGGRIYHVLTSHEGTDLDVRNCLNESRGSIPWIGFASLISVKDLSLILNSFELTASIAADIISSVCSIFVRAYDWEGYLHWEKSGAP